MIPYYLKISASCFPSLCSYSISTYYSCIPPRWPAWARWQLIWGWRGRFWWRSRTMRLTAGLPSIKSLGTTVSCLVKCADVCIVVSFDSLCHHVHLISSWRCINSLVIKQLKRSNSSVWASSISKFELSLVCWLLTDRGLCYKLQMHLEIFVLFGRSVSEKSSEHCVQDFFKFQ